MFKYRKKLQSFPAAKTYRGNHRWLENVLKSCVTQTISQLCHSLPRKVSIPQIIINASVAAMGNVLALIKDFFSSQKEPTTTVCFNCNSLRHLRFESKGELSREM